MNCPKARSLFTLFYDRELREKGTRDLEAHFEECPECLADYRGFVRSLEILKRLQPLDPPALPPDRRPGPGVRKADGRRTSQRRKTGS